MPISVVKVPVRKLFESVRIARSAIFPISVGITPVKVLSAIFRIAVDDLRGFSL